MNREQRKQILENAITEVLAKLNCIDTDRAIEAFNNFINVTLEDEFGNPCDNCACNTCDACADCYGCRDRDKKNPACKKHQI